MRSFLIFDTSAIFNLGERSGGKGEVIIRHLHDEYALLLPPAVKDEVMHDPPADFDYAALLKQYFTIKAAGPPEEYDDRFRLLSADLDAGEVEVLALGLAVKSKVVIDEKLARQAARHLGLEITGTIGLLQEAVDRQWIEAEAALSRVRAINQAGGRLPKIEAAKNWEAYFAQVMERSKA
ncbi:MAG: hypothetical protein SF339_03360 [Blastocatellia bacterium]|nr:hypothetical protein [Blastocatellia bacterium]